MVMATLPGELHGLALRMLALAAVVLALARPSAPRQGGVRVLAEAHDAVILVDVSASTQLRVDDERELGGVRVVKEPGGHQLSCRIGCPRAAAVRLRPHDHERRVWGGGRAAERQRRHDGDFSACSREDAWLRGAGATVAASEEEVAL